LVTVGELHAAIMDMLTAAGVMDTEFDCGVILEDFAKLPRGAESFMRDDAVPDEDAALALSAAKRRAAGEPLQYILGKWEFWGLPFYVGPGVLIPRQETEVLVEAVLARFEKTSAPKMADLCSGSGCVAVSLAKELPNAAIWALEKSPEAVSYLERNIELNGAANVRAQEADVLAYDGVLSELDCVVSNPPYVKAGEIPTLQREIALEPHMAFDGGEDGLTFYRGITRLWRDRLRDGGVIAFETDDDEAAAVCGILESAGFAGVSVRKDYSGLSRVVTATK